VHTLVHTTTGIVALCAAAAAAVSLLFAGFLAWRLWTVRAAQRTILGGDRPQDLVEHAAQLTREFGVLTDLVHDTAERLEDRVGVAEKRLDGAIAHRALVRYDAYNEMSGQQSSSIALLDANRSGVVLSSIHHRDQARLYVKQVREGEAEHELSPEEAEAVRIALDDNSAKPQD
jgi:hypothetical protein